MFGCLFGLVRKIVFLAVLIALVGGAYYYLKLHPEKSPWKGGVAAVKDKVETAKLGAEVKAALSLRESFKNLDITVSAEKDVVTLRGRVPSSEVSKEIERVSASVPGVRQVVSFLEVDPGAGVPDKGADSRSLGEKVDDQALELKIRAAFKLDKQLADAGFEVTATRRVVRLSAPNATDEQKKRAMAVARTVAGVVSVSM